MDAVLNWLWQGSVVAVASFVMLLALERARANVRYLVCWAALLLSSSCLCFRSSRRRLTQGVALTAGRRDGLAAGRLVDVESGVVRRLDRMGERLVRQVCVGVVVLRRTRARSRAFPSC